MTIETELPAVKVKARELTESQFSMQCAFIAKNAASWAGDILTLPERCNEPADAKTVARFTADMRGRLDRLDEWAGVTPAESRCEELVKALEPFSDMAGEMFARNRNASEIVVALDNPGDSHRVTVGDFFAARRALKEAEGVVG